MISSSQLIELLAKYKVETFYGVPDSLLANFCSYLTGHFSSKKHIITANEGNAIALASGQYLGSNEPSLVYLQNSGLGNVINPLVSLADREVYSIPMVLLIGWRGEPSQPDEPQHLKQGRITKKILEDLEIPSYTIGPSTENPLLGIQDALNTMVRSSSPVAILIKKGTFADEVSSTSKSSTNLLLREEVLQSLIPILPKNSLVVSSTGMLSRELYELRARTNKQHYRDFLTVGSMGHASSIAMGLALTQNSRDIVCIDGDGALLMHLGSLPIIGSTDLTNFVHIVLNNGAHDSVGGQPTVAKKINIPLIAKSSNYRQAITLKTRSEINQIVPDLINKRDGPTLIEIQIRTGYRGDLGRPLSSPKQNKESFMKYLMEDNYE